MRRQSYSLDQLTINIVKPNLLYAVSLDVQLMFDRIGINGNIPRRLLYRSPSDIARQSGHTSQIHFGETAHLKRTVHTQSDCIGTRMDVRRRMTVLLERHNRLIAMTME